MKALAIIALVFGGAVNFYTCWRRIYSDAVQLVCAYRISFATRHCPVLRLA